MKIGVLAMQGAFIEHIHMLEKLKVTPIRVLTKEQLDDLDGLIIPGGESTAMSKLLDSSFKQKLEDKISSGLPTFGTCAGMILLAKSIVNEAHHMPLIHIKIVRNGYGRQLGSFIAHEKVKGIKNEPFPMVFIRAPYIQSVGENVAVLAKVDGKIVAAKNNHILVTSFHPELTSDTRVHKYFINAMILKKL